MDEYSFDGLDRALKQLAMSDSTMQYAPHIRPEFNVVIAEINKIKGQLNIQPKDSNEYFDC